jgi:hypothetical protein
LKKEVRIGTGNHMATTEIREKFHTFVKIGVIEVPTTLPSASVAHQHTFPCKISDFTKLFINNKPIFLKLRIFTNFNTVFPVIVLISYFVEFSEEALHDHFAKPSEARRITEI